MSLAARLRGAGFDLCEVGAPLPWRGWPALPVPAQAPVAVRAMGRVVWVYDLGGVLLGRGAPDVEADLCEAWADHGWRPPEVLRRIYAAHGGIGPLGTPEALWWRAALWPAGWLEPLSARVRFGLEDVLYAPADWFLFAADGQGGGWVVDEEGQGARWRPGCKELVPAPLEVALQELVGAWGLPG